MRQRMRRGEPAPDDATVIVRANRLDPDLLTKDAQKNFEIYRFFGISVFAELAEATWMSIARDKFAEAPWIVLFEAGALVDAGLDLWDTGPCAALRHCPRRPRRARTSYSGDTAPRLRKPLSPEERTMSTPRIDLGADFNMEDDEGRNWTLVRDAREGVTVAPGAVLVAGEPGFWAVVRIIAVHDDGMVTFERLTDDDPAARPVLAEATNG